MVEDKILALIKERGYEYVSGEELSKSLGISRAGIWKHIEKLRKDGYDICASPHLGYKLISSPDILTSAEIGWKLKTKILGKTIYSYRCTDSTNTIAYQLAEKGQKEGTVIIAEEQKCGRGRLGRRWCSPPGGIYMSLILRPSIEPQDAQKLTLCAACAVADAIRKRCRLLAEIKWPNDILINKKKVCGILTEMKAEQDRIEFIILGIGINVNTSLKSLPRGATSISAELKQQTSKVALTQNVLLTLEYYYELMHTHFDKVIWEGRRLSSTLGNRVRVKTHNSILEGLAQDIDEHGALILRLDNGFRLHILTGEIERCLF